MAPKVLDAMPASKVDSKKQRRKEAAAQLAKQEQALQQLVRDAERDADPLRNFSAFCSFNRNDLQARVEAWAAGALPPALAEWALALCRSNMQDIYEGVWGWSDKKKRRQLAHESSRFLIAFDGLKQASESEGDTEEEPTPLAYVNFRFEVEDGEPLAYCYEVQLEEKAQRRGLGKHMMQLLELMAARYGMKGVMLTVMRSNAAAISFYSRLGYTEHESSPGVADPDEETGYQILCKPLGKRRAAGAAVQAAAAAAAVPATAAAGAAALQGSK